MNEHDRKNLDFLLRADRDTLHDWFERMSKDDLDYAWELLEAYSQEVADRAQDLLLDAQLEKQVFGQDRFPEANAVLSRFRIKK